jgi:hypothetical protein
MEVDCEHVTRGCIRFNSLLDATAGDAIFTKAEAAH